MCVRVCVCVCACASVRACVRAFECVRACVCVCAAHARARTPQQHTHTRVTVCFLLPLSVCNTGTTSDIFCSQTANGTCVCNDDSQGCLIVPTTEAPPTTTADGPAPPPEPYFNPDCCDVTSPLYYTIGALSVCSQQCKLARCLLSALSSTEKDKSALVQRSRLALKMKSQQLR